MTKQHPLLVRFPLGKDEGERIISAMAETQTHEKRVLEWRNESFDAMGFDEVMAALLAHTHIDMAQMRDLLANGCQHETAVRILMGTNFLGDDPEWSGLEFED